MSCVLRKERLFNILLFSGREFVDLISLSYSRKLMEKCIMKLLKRDDDVCAFSVKGKEATVKNRNVE